MNFKKDKTTYTILLIAGIFIVIGGVAIVKITGFDDLIGGIGGLGGAWIGLSSIKLYQIKNNPQKYEKQIIGQYDERNIAIRGYAGYATSIITLVAIGIMLFVFMFLDDTLALAIGAGLFLIHIVSFLLFARHYGKKI